MRHFIVGAEWMDRVMPEGFLIPSSTLISGPGGSGKPLIGLAVVSAWLRRGGKVVFVPLQFPDPSYMEADLQTLCDIRLSDYAGSALFVRFDLDLDVAAASIQQTSAREVRANLVNPAAWDRAMEVATGILGPSELGTLVFGSALNLLLFSPAYGEAMLARLQSLLSEPKNLTYLFSVSSNVLRPKITMLEEAADNLLFAEMKEPEKVLRFRVARLREAPYLPEVVTVPYERRTLEQMKDLADTSREANIRAIRQI